MNEIPKGLVVKDINKVKAGINRVVIKLNHLNDTLSFKDGTKLYLETKYTPAAHTQVIGTVQSVPEHLYFNKSDPGNSMEWKTDMELSKGDKVYIEYFAVMMALAGEYDQAASYPDPTWFSHDGDIYIIVRYADIYFKVPTETNLGTLTPINGYLVGKAIHLKTDTTLIIASKKSARWVQVTHVGKPAQDFVEKKYKDIGDIIAGDIVLIKQHANQRIENNLHKTLDFKDDNSNDEFGDYVVVQRRWCFAKVSFNMKRYIVNGALK
jgi:hypothetical protein